MYHCEGCRGTFARFKRAGQCPLCKRWASVRCGQCRYTADAIEFIKRKDRCPSCNARVAMPGAPLISARTFVAIWRLAKFAAWMSLVLIAYFFSAKPMLEKYGSDPPNLVNRFYSPLEKLAQVPQVKERLSTWPGVWPPTPNGKAATGPAESDSIPAGNQAVAPALPGSESADQESADLGQDGAAPPFRVWTDRKGRTVEARLLEAKDGKITLGLRGGKRSMISVDVLSDADQQHVQSLTHPAEDSTVNNEGEPNQPAAP